MSASTVSITANPASARRRPVLVTDKKCTAAIDLVAVENGRNGAVGDDNVTAGNSKDLSHHSIRGDAKDLATVKKTAGNPTVSPRRVRKGPLRPDKPWWLTAISIFTKNFVLLIVILGLVQLIRRLSLQSPGTNTAMFSDFEVRISEVEGMLKKTSKMIQLQVDVVDKKVESEIGILRGELSKKIEDKTAILESELKTLEAKSDSLESYLSELKGKDWLPKEEFDSFVEDLKKAKIGSGSSTVSLDDVKAYARDIVLKEIDKHAADGLARVDYALASGGAFVYWHSQPYVVGKGSSWFSMSNQNGVHRDASKMLFPSFGEPGACFPLKGNNGFVEIRLRTAVIPEAVTLEHVAKSVAYDRTSAPKDCRVSGWFQVNTDSAAIKAEKMSLLTEFTYDLEKSNAQTFNVLDSAAATGIINTVRLDVVSNHGNPAYTCIYRFRVHGHEPDPESLLAMQS